MRPGAWRKPPSLRETSDLLLTGQLNSKTPTTSDQCTMSHQKASLLVRQAQVDNTPCHKVYTIHFSRQSRIACSPPVLADWCQLRHSTLSDRREKKKRPATSAADSENSQNLWKSFQEQSGWINVHRRRSTTATPEQIDTLLARTLQNSPCPHQREIKKRKNHCDQAAPTSCTVHLQDLLERNSVKNS